MSNRKTRLERARKNTVGEVCCCLLMAAVLLFLGITGIHSGTVLVGGTRHVPGTPVYGEEAMTVAVLYIIGATVSILWLCRHRSWFFKAIVAALFSNAIVAIMAFSRHF